MVKTFRFHTLNGSLHIQTQLDGTFVRHSDYATLEAQLAELEAEVERTNAGWDHTSKMLGASNARAYEAERVLAEALKALEPFARAADNFDGSKVIKDDTEWLVYGGSCSVEGTTGSISVADLRAARRAREGGKADG